MSQGGRTGVRARISGLKQPAGLALDVAGGKMYWADLNGHDIRRANLDGSGFQTLIPGQMNPVGIAFAEDLVVPVPEPSSWVLLCSGLFASLVALARRRAA